MHMHPLVQVTLRNLSTSCLTNLPLIAQMKSMSRTTSCEISMREEFVLWLFVLCRTRERARLYFGSNVFLLSASLVLRWRAVLTTLYSCFRSWRWPCPWCRQPEAAEAYSRGPVAPNPLDLIRPLIYVWSRIRNVSFILSSVFPILGKLTKASWQITEVFICLFLFCLLPSCIFLKYNNLIMFFVIATTWK